MQITQNMQSYIQDLKSLSEVSNFKNLNKKDKAFEVIYQKAQDAKIDLSNAKEFLSSLSDKELSIIQKNKSLADPINVKNLSGEGAYNLLVHGYENIDYNGDGITETGITKGFNILPMREHGVDKFVVKTSTFDDNYIARLKDKLEHPKGGEYISPEVMKSMQFFFKTYDKISQDYDKSLVKAQQEVQQKANTTKVALEKIIPKHESRYETLMKMNHNNMTLAEHKEFSHLSANRPLEFLSDEANKALAKSLEGKSDEEKGQIKAIISLEFTISMKMNDDGSISHGSRDFSQKKHDEVVSKIEEIIKNTYQDTIGTVDVLKDFLSIYSKNQEEKKSQKATLEDLLKKQSA